MLRAVSTIGGYTLLSRIFGFVRDTLMASFLGAGYLADAFFVAFKLPNFLRRLFAEGAFNAAFVPLFAGTLEEHGRDAAQRFAEHIFAVLAVVLLAITILAELFMPWVLNVFAPGFTDDPVKFDLTVNLARLTFPYILFISLVTLYSGILNSLDKFAAVAAAPIMLNIVMIAALFWLTPVTETPAHALAIGVTLSGIAQLVWLAIACQRAGMLPRLVRPRLTPEVKRMLWLAAPAAFGASVAQINLLIDTILASTLPGAVSFLYYADRIIELPVGVIGVAVGTALLPMLSKTIRAGRNDEANAQTNQAMLLALAVTFPAASGIIALAEPITLALFEHGNFQRSDTLAVVPAMIAFACALPAFILVKVFAPGFYARQDTKTPVKIGIACLLLNLMLNLTLIGPLEHVGLASSTAIAGWVNALAMAVILHRRGHFHAERPVVRRLSAALLASLIMGAALWFAQPLLPRDTGWHEIVGLIILVGLGGAIYAILAFAFGVVTRADLRALRPKRKVAS